MLCHAKELFETSVTWTERFSHKPSPKKVPEGSISSFFYLLPQKIKPFFWERGFYKLSLIRWLYLIIQEKNHEGFKEWAFSYLPRRFTYLHFCDRKCSHCWGYTNPRFTLGHKIYHLIAYMTYWKQEHPFYFYVEITKKFFFGHLFLLLIKNTGRLKKCSN